jgi:putative endonuclease
LQKTAKLRRIERSRVFRPSFYFTGNTFGMRQHLDSGEWGETLAAQFLREAGYTILERNWRYKRAEIDIIARDGDILVFVEVKTRAYISFGRPEEMVGFQKKRMLYDAAAAYMRHIGHDWEIRFDIIGVTGSEGRLVSIEHFKDAFYPGI